MDSLRLTVTDLVPLTEQGLRRLDEAAASQPIDDALLQITPARDLSQTLDALIAALRSLDVGQILSRSGWWSRFVGADIEARLEFELACQNLVQLQETARRRATAARAVGSQLWKTGQALKADQQRLEAVIGVCRTAIRLPEVAASDPALLSRFQRRGANLMALHTSQTLTIKQIEMAISLLTSLLDRHLEVEQLLLPIWRHSGIAAAHGDAREPKAKATLADLHQIHAGIAARAEALLETRNV